MHEFHAWVGLAESPLDDDDERFVAGLAEVERIVADSVWHDATFAVKCLNGSYFFTATGLVNRRRAEGERLDLLLSVIAEKLPGSWGLVYERDDEMPEPHGPNAFRVRVLARGLITERVDHFLSPCMPVIED